MRVSRHWLAAIVLAPCLFGLATADPLPPQAPASGGQTPDGAHQFLKLTLPQSVYRGGAYYEKVKAVEREMSRMRYELFDSKITGWTQKSKCVDRVAISEMTMNASYLQTRRDGVVLLNASEFDANWAELVQVRADDGDVYLQWKGSARESMIMLKSKDMAARVAYAMDFLRRACDPTAETGF